MGRRLQCSKVNGLRSQTNDACIRIEVGVCDPFRKIILFVLLLAISHLCMSVSVSKKGEMLV